MKSPDEIKCGLECIRTNVERICVKPQKGQCPRCEQVVGRNLELEAIYSQVIKALCGKENATLEEVLLAVEQLRNPFVDGMYGGMMPQDTYIRTLQQQHEEASAERDVRSKLAIEQCTRIGELERELSAVKRERDAAVADIKTSQNCSLCIHCPKDDECEATIFLCMECDKVGCVCRECFHGEKLEWRGVCPENAEVQEDG